MFTDLSTTSPISGEPIIFRRWIDEVAMMQVDAVLDLQQRAALLSAVRRQQQYVTRAEARGRRARLAAR